MCGCAAHPRAYRVHFLTMVVSRIVSMNLAFFVAENSHLKEGVEIEKPSAKADEGQ